MRASFAITIGIVISLAAVAAAFPRSAHARLTRITTDSTTTIDFPSFGATGPYLKIKGTYEGEIDPDDPHNAVIVDLNLAPKVNGKVRYASTFYILRPVDLSRGNRKLLYFYSNRGHKAELARGFADSVHSNDPTTAEHFGHGFPMRRGYAIAWSGWAGDALRAPDRMTIDLPIAKNPDGTSIVGDVVVELIPREATTTTIALPYAAADASSANGMLTLREHQGDPKIPIADWSYVNDRSIRIPGPSNVQWIYEFVYKAKDPVVMGIGHAAVRDLLSFFKWGTADDVGNANPLAGGATAIFEYGVSLGGRVQRDFLYWGFNDPEPGVAPSGSKVVDGMMAWATGSGGFVWMNYRFAQPTVSSQQHSRHHAHEPEYPHTFAVRHDPLTNQIDGIFKRCAQTNTCPKFMNIDSPNEYWNKSSSLNHTDAYGNDLDIDALQPDARVYLMSSIQHTSSSREWPKFSDMMGNPGRSPCQQMNNPLHYGPIHRALLVALDDWATKGVRPPPSAVPKRSDGTLVAPDQLKFPKIPATHYDGWPATPPVQWNPGAMRRNRVLDFSIVPYQPIEQLEYKAMVPQVDKDGNDIAGIRMPYITVPLGTHTGWSLLRAGAGGPDICGQTGQFIPFANTKAERAAARDPRLSIAERHKTHAHYVNAVKAETAKLVKARLMLKEDEERLVKQAETYGVRLWKPPAKP